MKAQWQIEQGNRCSCKGGDEMCPCQNVDKRFPPTPGIKAAVAKLDTSKLGPVRFDPNDAAQKARLVRGALMETARTVANSEESKALIYLAENGTNATLAKLRAFLR